MRALLRPYLGRIVSTLTVTALAALAEAGGLVILSIVLNLLVGTDGEVKGPAILGSMVERARQEPGLFFFLLGAMYVGKGILGLLANYVSISLALRMADDWRMRLLDGLLRSRTRDLPEKQGAMVHLIMQEPGFAGAGLSAAGIMLQNLAAAFTVYGTLLWVSPIVTLGLTAVSVVAVLALSLLTRYARRLGRTRLVHNREGYGYVTEMLSALKQLRIFGLSERMVASAGEHVDRMRWAELRVAVVTSSPRLVIEIIFMVAFVLMLAILTPRMGETATVTALGLAAAAAIRLLPSFSAAAGTWVQLEQALPSLERIREQLARLDAQGPEIDAIGPSPSPLDDRIEIRGVRFSYPGRDEALRGVDLTIEHGRFTAIVGPSGCGKSTLVDLISGMYEPDAGDILVDGVALRTLSRKAWRTQLGVVLQDGFLLSGTLRDNLTMLRPDCAEERLRETIRLVGAEQMVADLPNGIDTVVGERGHSLSGGQRQRIALARVLLKEPRVLILDEATSALDTKSDEAFYLALEEHYRGRITLVVIAHRLASVRRADRIYVIESGRVVESGDHDSLLKSEGLYAALSRGHEHTIDAS